MRLFGDDEGLIYKWAVSLVFGAHGALTNIKVQRDVEEAQRRMMVERYKSMKEPEYTPDTLPSKSEH